MCGSNIYVSRIGGDEFNMMAPGDMPEAAVEAWCESLLACLAKSFLIDDRQVLISGSIGCCRSTADEGGIGLIQMADYALLHAKRSGRNRLTVFREEHASDATERFRIEQALRSADLSRELELLYQPQWDVRLQRIVAAEALARWNSPVLGPVSPSRFIMVAEESGLIANITLTVLNKVLATLQHAGQSLTLSMNLSGHDLLADDIVDNIIGRVAASGIDPAMLEFEITETALMPDIGRASANVARLARCGHPVALDDFGTGYSNFQYLRTLPISTLKVDRSFMVNATDVMTEKLLSSLAGMARTLGVQCLFEGVETEIELLLAKRAGAQLIQGYLIGKPMTWDQLTSMIGVDERADADFLRAANVR
jgi:predicted signal transduction protein with EAL and GGDEF domain